MRDSCNFTNNANSHAFEEEIQFNPANSTELGYFEFRTICPRYAPGGYSLIWAIRGRAAGQGMVFWPRRPKQDIQ